MSVRVRVDLKNPGHFFACCGLFELAERLAGGALARFEANHFVVEVGCSLSELLDCLTTSQLEQIEVDDETASPIQVGKPFDLRLDWWKDTSAGGRELKVWAGTMQCGRIFRSMVSALRETRFHCEEILDVGGVVYDPEEKEKKVEPFYFDARRAPNSHARDVGFSPNDLDLTTTAFAGVEALSLVGLQRCRPAPVEERKRVFDYHPWSVPIPLTLAAPVTAGLLRLPGERRYQFEVWFRTGQKKHKAFRPAVFVEKGESSDA